MKIIITNPHNGRRWRLRPYSNGLCLAIDKSPLSKVNPKNGKPVKSEFVPCDKYPSTWDQGLKSMLDLMMNDSEDETELEIEDLKEAPTMLKNVFTKWLSDVTVEIKRSQHV